MTNDIISDHTGQIYEDQADFYLNRPMDQGKQPLRVTITPHMNAGEDQTDTYGEQTDSKEGFFKGLLNRFFPPSPDTSNQLSTDPRTVHPGMGHTLPKDIAFQADRLNSSGDEMKKFTDPALSMSLDNQDQFDKSIEAMHRSPVSQLGFDPSKTFITRDAKETNVAGTYRPKQDVIWSNAMYNTNLIHEQMHRGLQQLQDAGLIPKGDQEHIVRRLMYKHFGNIEGQHGPDAKREMESALATTSDDDVSKIEKIAADHFNKLHPGLNYQKDHKLFFVRHGETEDNEENIVRTKDAQLTDTGRKQAEVAAKQLKSEGVDAIVSSNLPRAKESAHIIAAKLGIVPQFDNQLNTWDMGKLEGQPCDATNTKLMKDAVEKTPDEPVGGGESFNQFKDRSQAGIRDAINNNQGKKLAILTHSKVEATLKAWEKTGQDNPSIDAPTVNKEPDKPGSVEPFTMQANSTIMQGGANFDQRFQGMPPGLPQKAPGESFEGTPSLYHPSLKSPTEFPTPDYGGGGSIRKMPYEIDDPGEKLRQYYKQDYVPLGVKPYPGKGPTTQSDTPLSRYFQGQGDTLAEQLMSIIQHPEQMVGPGELGMAMPPGRLLQGRFIAGIQKMLDAGKSFADIGETLGMTRDAIAGLVKRNNLKAGSVSPSNRSGEGRQPRTPLLDKDFDELGNWYQNQFEGGPIEGEMRGANENEIQAALQPFRYLRNKFFPDKPSQIVPSENRLRSEDIETTPSEFTMKRTQRNVANENKPDFFLKYAQEVKDRIDALELPKSDKLGQINPQLVKDMMFNKAIYNDPIYKGLSKEQQGDFHESMGRERNDFFQIKVTPEQQAAEDRMWKQLEDMDVKARRDKIKLVPKDEE